MKELKKPVCHVSVALPTEGVDRNTDAKFDALTDRRRPPHGGRG